MGPFHLELRRHLSRHCPASRPPLPLHFRAHFVVPLPPFVSTTNAFFFGDKMPFFFPDPHCQFAGVLIVTFPRDCRCPLIFLTPLCSDFLACLQSAPMFAHSPVRSLPLTHSDFVPKTESPSPASRPCLLPRVNPRPPPITPHPFALNLCIGHCSPILLRLVTVGHLRGLCEFF